MCTGALREGCGPCAPGILGGMDVAAQVRKLGGFAQKQQLVARGASDRDLTEAVRRGDVSRARQGWYTTLPAMDLRVRAVRVGGRLTGLSAIEAWGGWVLEHGILHVAVPRNAARLRSQFDRRVHPPAPRIAGVRLHWQLRADGDAASVSMLEALECVLHHESRETAIAALDWALHRQLVDRLAVERLLFASNRINWSDLDPDCESLPESLARTRLRLAGHVVRSQVPLDNAQPIDLVVDGVVALEVDGEEFHRDRFVEDRTKDARIIRANLVPYRAPAVAVFRDWPSVEATVAAAIASRHVGNSGEQPRKRRPKRVSVPARHPIPDFPTEGAGMPAGARPLHQG